MSQSASHVASTLVPVRLRSALVTSHSGDAPLVFVLMLRLLAAVVLAELTSGGMDA